MKSISFKNCSKRIFTVSSEPKISATITANISYIRLVELSKLYTLRKVSFLRLLLQYNGD